MGLGRIFLNSAAMRRFHAALDEIDVEVFQQFSSVRDFLNEQLRSEASKAESRKTIAKVMGGGVDPKTTAYLFIRVVLEDLLLDGEYHFKKGQLTQDGQNFFAVYNNVVRELRARDWFTAPQADENFQAIRNGIAAVDPETGQSENPD